MKFVLKWGLRLLILFVALIVVFLLSFDSIVKAMFTRQIRAQSGMDVKIGKLSVGLFSSVITVEDFKLFNPAEFGGTPFLNIRELHVEYDRTSMAHRNLRCRLIRLDITELSVVKNDAGLTNLLALQSIKLKSKRADDIDFGGITVLNLSVGKLSYVDLKKPVRNREFKVNLKNQIYKDVKTTGDLYGVLILIWLRTTLVFQDNDFLPLLRLADSDLSLDAGI
jgi:uncharacterized protein involved in outer membrane biogenesis